MHWNSIIRIFQKFIESNAYGDGDSLEDLVGSLGRSLLIRRFLEPNCPIIAPRYSLTVQWT